MYDRPQRPAGIFTGGPCCSECNICPVTCNHSFTILIPNYRGKKHGTRSWGQTTKMYRNTRKDVPLVLMSYSKLCLFTTLSVPRPHSTSIFWFHSKLECNCSSFSSWYRAPPICGPECFSSVALWWIKNKTNVSYRANKMLRSQPAATG